MGTSKKALREDFRALDIKAGDTLLVHSSFKSMGELEGGADGFFEVLFDVLGGNGTAVFPTLTYRTTREDGIFHYYDTPACTGYLSEKFRSIAGVRRSIHPTHSCAVYGREGDFLIRDHEKDVTPVGINSPFTKLPIVGGKILMIGCGLHAMTSMHGVEESVDTPRFIDPSPFEVSVTDSEYNEYKLCVHRHFFAGQGLDQYYERLEDVMDEGLTLGRIGEAGCHLLDSQALWRIAHRIMMDDPYYFTKKHSS